MGVNATDKEHSRTEFQALAGSISIDGANGVLSPLTGSPNVARTEQIRCSDIVGSYKMGFGVDVRRYFSGMDHISIYKCLDTGYRFYHPFGLEGGEELYNALQRLSWYYMDWKWEHETAAGFIGPGARVLEIGCGFGGFLEGMRRKNVRCLGLEVNESAIEVASAKGLDVKKETIGDHARRYPQYYDCVCSFQVIEHIADVMPFMEACLSALKPGGRFVVSVPNNDALMFRCDDEQTLNRPPHHVGLWDLTSLVSLSSLLDLKIERILLEPLQQYHIEHSQKVLLTKFVSALGRNNEGIIKGHEASVLALSRFIVQCVPGHTILAVYSKKADRLAKQA